mmetsp:Transcript_43537/g.125855  ORF Transcript_43537/g.125855 Transcript_43537/m.125855 type:complete len:866 (-) Transcript_43537:365-2962(-)|eukprot:CAMPEP_0176026122 /NCGR_PEP_ID=MMETSP0120_2-20121206/12792_1 /TAXON_ID=160619 /ORGANISM="Kryptoperidinium foliaceum, Strain CCMP 1326" /LENGTH=865 /DNA_ID=CAMNT_0017359317 /DNA_START=55 /DNA_END=2652 /DNA_ORIENTATION=-
MTALWSHGGSRAAMNPMSEHHSPADFDGPGGDHSPGFSPFGQDAPMNPHVSVSKFDGRPLLGPGSPGYMAGPAPPPGAPDGYQSVSRFTGQPLNVHTPVEFLDGPSPVAHGTPPSHGAPMGPTQTHYYRRPPREDDVLTDCYGAGRSVWDVFQAFITGTRKQPTQGVCFYDANDHTTYGEVDPRWQYVGDGTHGYEEFRPYGYTGQGYDPRAMPQPHLEPKWRMRKSCLYFLLVIGVCAIVCALFGLLAYSTKVPFDCDSDLADAARGWSFKKKEWCCENAQKGCDLQKSVQLPNVMPEEPERLPASTQPTTSTEPWAHDCTAPKDRRETETWSPGRAAYCCLRAGVGCPMTTTPVPYDCEVGFLTFDKDWSASKKAWCCMRQRVGCPGHTPGVQPPTVAPGSLPTPPRGVPGYNCSSGFHNWEVGWGIGKKAYCCEYYGKGCPYIPTTTSVAYDCEAGSANWAQGWSLPKKIFCCQHSGKGCTVGRPMPVAPPSSCDSHCVYKGHDSTCKARVGWLVEHEQMGCISAHAKVLEECSVCHGCQRPALQCEDPSYDCNADFDNFEVKWPVEKRAWCCKHQGKSCVPSNHFDCDAGISDWSRSWSLDKKVFCCTHREKGCEHSAPTAGEYDCSTGFEASWSESKKGYCCTKEGKGCLIGFNCNEGSEDKWEPDKGRYCCAKYQKGCSVADDPFNCEVGLASWRVGWSPTKKTWCCKHAKKGCEDKFDCDAGLGNFKRGWTEAKKDWCCHTYQKGCEKPAHDCLAGLANAEKGWSDEKKEWCCEHGGVGCPHEAASPSVGEGAFDCEAAWANWEMAWSPKKKAYCCKSVGRACKAFDCSHDQKDMQNWHVQKVQWCCINEDVACSNTI